MRNQVGLHLENTTMYVGRHLHTPTLRTSVPTKAKVALRRWALVLRAEEFMWENVGEPLTLDYICTGVNCNARTLIYAFKEKFGVGPMTYFKVRRLHAVREKLQTSMQRNVRIFDIAAEYGFWHEGHFSADYKAMFGMTPSQTREAARVALDNTPQAAIAG
jgi:transcriptional regulator GlxA family with amidase domain